MGDWLTKNAAIEQHVIWVNSIDLLLRTPMISELEENAEAVEGLTPFT
jgi:hypothetical protein